MLLRNTKVAAAAAVVLGLGALASAGSTPFVLDFEGLGVPPHYDELVANFYNGGLGGSGSGPGPNYGVQFSSHAQAMTDADAHGLEPLFGNFGGEPTPDTIVQFRVYDDTITYAAGFTDGFSFYYAAPWGGGTVAIYDDVNGTGNVLATLDLPATPKSGAPDPTGLESPFVPLGVAFEGTAKSVLVYSEGIFDNITFGSATPLSGNTVPIPLPLVPDPRPPTNGVLMPLPTALPAGLGLLAVLGLMSATRRHRLA